MKKYLLIILIIVSGRCIGQNLQWAKAMGGKADEVGHSITLDVTGNVYTTGYFTDTVDFDPGAGVYNLVAAGFEDIFISKLDASGNFLWAKRIGGKGLDRGYSIVVDSTGNIFIAGFFQDTVDFDPGMGVSNLVSPINFQYFILKLNASGDFEWAHSADVKSNSFSTQSYSYSIALAPNGDICITGSFSGSMDFDPGHADYTFTSSDYTNTFILRLSAGGNFLWAKRIGLESNVNVRGITVDREGNIITTGAFNLTGDFDPGDNEFLLSSPWGPSIFISKLDAMGNFVWAKSIASFSPDNEGIGIIADASGNIYSTGHFQGTSDFDPGPGTLSLTAKGLGDIYILKLTAAGDFVWATNIGSTSNYTDYGYALTLDGFGNLYTTGYFYGVSDFDPGAGVFNISSAGGDSTCDTFILKMDTAGKFVWVKRIGGDGFELGNSIAVNQTGEVYVTGNFNKALAFDPGDGFPAIVTAGVSDIYILKLRGSQTLPVTLLEFNGQLKNESAILNWKTAQEINNAYFDIERSLDAASFTSIGKVLASTGQSDNQYSFTDFHIDQLNYPVIYYRLKQIDRNGGFTLSRIVALSVNDKNRMLLYPNPVEGTAHLSVKVSRPQWALIKITDHTGRVLIRREQELIAGNSSIPIEVNNLPAGLYYLELTGSSIYLCQKFSKH